MLWANETLTYYYILFMYEVSQKNLRSFDNMDLYRSKPNCEMFKKSLQYSGSLVWNSLPLFVKEATSLNVFKYLYKKAQDQGLIEPVEL